MNRLTKSQLLYTRKLTGHFSFSSHTRARTLFNLKEKRKKGCGYEVDKRGFLTNRKLSHMKQPSCYDNVHNGWFDLMNVWENTAFIPTLAKHSTTVFEWSHKNQTPHSTTGSVFTIMLAPCQYKSSASGSWRATKDVVCPVLPQRTLT